MSSLTERKPRHRVFIGALLVIVLVGGIASFFIRGTDAPKRKPVPSSIVNITLPPPLPPPPPPPPQSEPPPEEQKMVEAEAAVEEEPPDEAPVPEQPPSDLTTNLKGEGPNNFGLAQGSGRGGNGTIGGTGTGGVGSKWGRYNAGISRTIKAAIERHPTTGKASFPSSRVAFWLDADGRIVRAKMLDSTGSSAIDSAIPNEILPGLVYQAQPEGMPSPIVIRVSGRK